MQLTPTTELEAVNDMLAVIGESPVSTLDNTGFVDAVIARQLLHSTSRALQTKGWHFNTIDGFVIQPNSNGFLDVPLNTLKIDQTHDFDGAVDCVHRGLRIFDKKSQSFVFNQPVTFTITQFIAFDELPEYARHYIYIRAARLFQARMVGSETVAGLTAEEENNAWVEFLNADGEVSDYTMIGGNSAVGNILMR